MNTSTYTSRALAGLEFASCDEQMAMIRKRNTERAARCPELARILSKSEPPPATEPVAEATDPVKPEPSPKPVPLPDRKVMELCKRFDIALTNNLEGRNETGQKFPAFEAWKSAARWIERVTDAAPVTEEGAALVRMHVMDAKPKRPALNVAQADRLLQRFTVSNLERYADQARAEGKTFDVDRAWPAAQRGAISKLIGIALNEHKAGKTSMDGALDLLTWCLAKVEETYPNNARGRNSSITWYARVLKDLSVRVGIPMPDLSGPAEELVEKKANAA